MAWEAAPPAGCGLLSGACGPAAGGRLPGLGSGAPPVGGVPHQSRRGAHVPDKCAAAPSDGAAAQPPDALAHVQLLDNHPPLRPSSRAAFSAAATLPSRLAAAASLYQPLAPAPAGGEVGALARAAAAASTVAAAPSVAASTAAAAPAPVVAAPVASFVRSRGRPPTTAPRDIQRVSAAVCQSTMHLLQELLTTVHPCAADDHDDDEPGAHEMAMMCTLKAHDAYLAAQVEAGRVALPGGSPGAASLNVLLPAALVGRMAAEVATQPSWEVDRRQRDGLLVPPRVLPLLMRRGAGVDGALWDDGGGAGGGASIGHGTAGTGGTGASRSTSFETLATTIDTSAPHCPSSHIAGDEQGAASLSAEARKRQVQQVSTGPASELSHPLLAAAAFSSPSVRPVATLGVLPPNTRRHLLEGEASHPGAVRERAPVDAAVGKERRRTPSAAWREPQDAVERAAGQASAMDVDVTGGCEPVDDAGPSSRSLDAPLFTGDTGATGTSALAVQAVQGSDSASQQRVVWSNADRAHRDAGGIALLKPRAVAPSVASPPVASGAAATAATAPAAPAAPAAAIVPQSTSAAPDVLQEVPLDVHVLLALARRLGVREDVLQRTCRRYNGLAERLHIPGHAP